jgi:hypothetical protein
MNPIGAVNMLTPVWPFAEGGFELLEEKYLARNERDEGSWKEAGA